MLTIQEIFEEIKTSGGLTPSRRLRDIAKRFPDQVAFRDKRYGIWNEITYGEFWTQVQYVGSALNYFGVKRTDKVAIHSENRPEWLISDIGIQSLGAISVGLYPTNPPAEVQYLLSHSESKILFAEDQEQVDKALEVSKDVGNENMNNAVTLFGLIQTDAPITRGSSGGALLNNNGELIGITTAIATADVGAEGLGFAVPINLALGIVEDILDDGQVLHAFLGILGAQYFEVADDGARIFSGVLIEELYGPANDIYAIGKAGALPGDVIKKINGEKISTLDQLITILRNKRAGDEITVEILRNENIITLEFTLDLRPSDV